MELNVIDKKGKSVDTITLDTKVFGVETNEPLIAQYLRVFRVNQSQGTSAAKTRADVRGGGRKPWKQKGTGRARHGSTRSPIWVGGGAAHGPKPHKKSLTMPKKMKRAAFRSILSLKALKKQVVVVDDLKIKEPKTKDVVKLMKDIKVSGKVLFVTENKEDNLLKSASNIEKVNVALFENLNGFELMNAHNVVFEKKAVENLVKKYSK